MLSAYKYFRYLCCTYAYFNIQITYKSLIKTFPYTLNTLSAYRLLGIVYLHLYLMNIFTLKKSPIEAQTSEEFNADAYTILLVSFQWHSRNLKAKYSAMIQ